MRKLAVAVMFLALTGPAFAADNFVQRESDRSGVTGTLNMVGNSLKGFFSSIGSKMSEARTKATS